RAQQQLLSRLSPRIERARYLRAAEGAVGEQPAVFPRKRHSLRHALVDDVDAHLCQAVHVRLARTEIAAFDGVVKESIDAVAVVRIILGRVDATLRGDAVRAARAVLEAKTFYLIAEFGH